MNTTCDNASVPEEISDVERERVIRANSTYCKACEENGIQVCSWEKSPAWMDFVEGRINESELTERARQELEKSDRKFDSYKTAPSPEADPPKGEALLAGKAKQANRIYRQVCLESGNSRCLFQNFATWSDYVHGRINDEDFAVRAREQVVNMSESPGR